MPSPTRNKGSMVELYVPREDRPSVRWADLRSEQATAGGSPATDATLSGPILVVDDDAAILSVVSEFLEVMGFPVETATNGIEALRAFERRRPSLILLDMQMPILDGRAFAEALRDRGHGDVPILVVTASNTAKRWAKEIGAAGYIPKPLDLLDLLAAVEEFCAQPSSSATAQIGSRSA